jgi:DNA (cytosine-5)-methyltransferase 3A
MNVLSLFDGMSCGQQALDRAGIKVNNYFASEIDKYAIQVTMANYPETIQLGSVVNVDGYKLPKIDLLIGGSPCQSFSFAGKRKGMSTKCETEILTLEHYLELKAEGYEFEGQSYLFWEFMRLLDEVKPKYFLLENVEMGEKWERVLSKAIGVNGIHINSALVSAQNRKRIYWTNIGMQPSGLFGDMVSIIQQPKDKGILLKDVLESEVDEKYFISEKMIDRIKRSNNGEKCFADNQKSMCLAAGYFKQGRDNQLVTVHNTMPRSSTTGKGGTGPLSRTDGKTYCLDTGNTNAVEIKAVMLGRSEAWGMLVKNDGKSYTLFKEQPHGIKQNSRIRRLTPTECERLQTVKDNYTNYVSDSQRYKMLGNGWTIDVIAYIFNYIK